MTRPTTTEELFSCTNEDCSYITDDPFPHTINTGHTLTALGAEGSGITSVTVSIETADEYENEL